MHEGSYVEIFLKLVEEVVSSDQTGFEGTEAKGISRGISMVIVVDLDPYVNYSTV